MNHAKKLLVLITLASALMALAGASLAIAEETAAPASSEKVDVENIKEKYWARGDESELGVVQNRLYSKARKFELGVFGGFMTSDPFLSVKGLGASLGYHFSEVWAFHVVGWKSYASSSSALETLVAGGKKANTNIPRSYVGGEFAASILYGKLSLIGKKIIYYDMHLLGGAGATSTENGTYFTPHIGIGQQIYLNQWSSIRVDYRMMRYDERIKEKETTPILGQDVGGRTNWTNAITIGVDFLFGGPSDKQAPKTDGPIAPPNQGGPLK
jgi:outer membrane beta-barrel protein